MVNKIRKIGISFFTFLLLIFSNIHFCAANQDESYPLVFDHWAISCDNYNVCYAVGFPFSSDDRSDESSWYIWIQWNGLSKKIIKSHITVRTTNKINEIFGLDSKKEQITLPISNNYKETESGNYTYDLHLDDKTIIQINSLAVRFNVADYKVWTLDLTDFKKFYDTHKFSVVTTPKPISAYPVVNYKDLTEEEATKLVKKYKIDEYCEQIDGFSFEVSDLKITAICEEYGYNFSYVLLYDREKRQNLPIVSNKMVMVQNSLSFGGELLTEDNASRLGVPHDGDDRYEFYVGVLGSSGGEVGTSVRFVYDGRQFQVIAVESMPVRIAADFSDWLIIYSAPYEKKTIKGKFNTYWK